MNFNSTPETMQDRYSGYGHAIGTLDTSGKLNSILYIRDILPQWDDENPDMDLLATDERMQKIIKSLEKDFGPVIFGFFSVWDCCES